MTRNKLRELIREVLSELQEANVTGGTATFSPGTGAQYATPFAFSKKGRKNRATKYGEKLGYKTVKKKKRPYNTKLVDYLHNENSN
jgi:hypothetical protein